jgi:hypothetical protein
MGACVESSLFHRFNFSEMLHFRKFSPIDKKYPIFELVEGDVVLLDVSANENGEIEVAVHEGAANRVLSLDVLTGLLEQGRKLVEDEL